MEQYIIGSNRILHYTTKVNGIRCYIGVDHVIVFYFSNRIIHCSTQSVMSYVLKSKDYLSIPNDLSTSLWINDSFSSPLLPVGPLSFWPLTIHACRQHDVATWGQSADSSPWHPPRSRPLTHYKGGCLPGHRFACCLTAVRHKKPPGPVDTGIKRDNGGTDWEAPVENNTSCCLANHHICLTWMVYL